MKAPFTFLVVDDNENNRFLTRYALEREFKPCVVIEAASVEEALVQCTRREFDAVLTDNQLGGPDGSALIVTLRAQSRKCPIVMVTASSDPAVHRRAYDAGASRVFFGSELKFVDYLRESLGPR